MRRIYHSAKSQLAGLARRNSAHTLFCISRTHAVAGASDARVTDPFLRSPSRGTTRTLGTFPWWSTVVCKWGRCSARGCIPLSVSTVYRGVEGDAELTLLWNPRCKCVPWLPSMSVNVSSRRFCPGGVLRRERGGDQQDYFFWQHAGTTSPSQRNALPNGLNTSMCLVCYHARFRQELQYLTWATAS